MVLLTCHGPTLEKLVFCKAEKKAIRGTAQKSGTNLPKKEKHQQNEQVPEFHKSG